MTNRLTQLFSKKSSDILNVYFTAGHPALDSTAAIISGLTESGVDLIEVGMPYSDPMADGETIQRSSARALANGMTLQKLFGQLQEVRQSVDTPIVLMGYLNQMMQYGVERFLSMAQESGVDGLIIPDLPMDIFQNEYAELFRKYNMCMSFLVTPQTSDERIRIADDLSSGFLYVVSQSSITGGSGDISEEQKSYFERIEGLDLKSPRLIGFGIHDRQTYETACRHAHGAIIGSAFIRAIDGCDEQSLETSITAFVSGIKNKKA